MRIPGLNKAEKRELGQQICKHHEANLVEGIGNVIVIYRCNPGWQRILQVLLTVYLERLLHNHSF